MAEIKSTLDLIMEKTRGLTLSTKEKEDLRREGWLRKARGLIQKYIDDRIDLEKIKEALFDSGRPQEWETILKKELFDGLDPEGENERRFQLIDEFLHLPREILLNIFRKYDQRILQEKNRLAELQLKDLSGLGISGSAVVPNLNQDPSWQRFNDQEKKACKKQIAAL